MSVWFLDPVPLEALLRTRAMLTIVSTRMTEFTCDRVKKHRTKNKNNKGRKVALLV